MAPTAAAPTASESGHGVSLRARNIITSTIVIGGVLVLALLVYAVYRRRRGATVSDIVHFRPHPPGTVLLRPGLREPRLTEFPTYRESRYSIKSSKYQNFQHQNPYVRHMWKTAHPPSGPASPVRETHPASSGDCMPASPESATGSQVTMKTIGSRETIGSRCQEKSRNTTKSWISISERPLTESDQDGELASPLASPSSRMRPAKGDDKTDRWSWTNTDAPPTPRMYAPSLRSSISSLPRFRTIRSWVKGEPHRIPEESIPTTSSIATNGVKKKPRLRNRASFPMLAPLITPVTDKLSKKHGRVGSLSSIFMVHPETKVPIASPPPVALEEEGPVLGLVTTDYGCGGWDGGDEAIFNMNGMARTRGREN